MDYEKAYKEAIERAETLIEKLESAHIKGFIYHIFPELKEDKDKRIKCLIKGCVYASDISPEGKEEIFAWLEKQGEQKPTWSEEDERICQCLIRDQEKALDEVRNDKYGHSEIISDLKEMYRERIDWLKSLK